MAASPGRNGNCPGDRAMEVCSSTARCFSCSLGQEAPSIPAASGCTCDLRRWHLLHRFLRFLVRLLHLLLHLGLRPRRISTYQPRNLPTHSVVEAPATRSCSRCSSSCASWLAADAWDAAVAAANMCLQGACVVTQLPARCCKA